MRSQFMQVIVQLLLAAPVRAQTSGNQLSGAQMEKFLHAAAAAKILQCMVTYQFDFVSDTLGLSVSVGDRGSGPPDAAARGKMKLNQFQAFLETGQLALRPETRHLKMEISKDLAYRCKVVAESLVEVEAVQTQFNILYRQNRQTQRRRAAPPSAPSLPGDSINPASNRPGFSI